MKILKLTDISFCMIIFILGVSLIFLSSCSVSNENLSTTSSSITDQKNTTDPPVSLTSAQSITLDRNASHSRPTRPFPDFAPNYLQFISQELLNDYNDNNFIVGENRIAANYQVWHEFIGKVSNNKDITLTIQTFDIDSTKEVNDTSRYQQHNRYQLIAKGDESIWKYLSVDKNDITGKLSFVHDTKTGIHEVLIGDIKVFEFIYFPSDLTQAALFFGYTPLMELPTDYTSDQAMKDGCLTIEQGVIQNIDVLKQFEDSFGDYYDVGCFIRIYTKDDEGITVMDIGAYNERVCILADYSRRSNVNNTEDMYITTYYDNFAVGAQIHHDGSTLSLSSDFRETVFILRDIPAKSN